MQGYIAGVWGVSSVVGPTLGGVFSEYVSWRWIFFVNIPIGLIAAAAIGLRFHERVERRRPSPRKKSKVSMISRTSPSASAYGLPISAVTSFASASALSSIRRPMWAIARPRIGAGIAAHS